MLLEACIQLALAETRERHQTASPEINAAIKLDNIRTAHVSINNVPFANSHYFFYLLCTNL